MLAVGIENELGQVSVRSKA